MKLLRNRYFWGAIILIFLTSQLPVQGAIFNLSGGIDIYGTYDDNLLLIPDDQYEGMEGVSKEDKILQIKPFIQIAHESKRSMVLFKYQLFKEWYDTNQNLNRTDKSYSNASLLADWDVTDKITLGFYDSYTDSLYGLERAEVPENREDYITNTAVPSIQYTHSDHLGLDLSLTWQFTNYDEPPIYYGDGVSGYDDSEQLGVNLNGFLRVMEKTDVTFGGGVWVREYDNDCPECNSDSDGYDLRVGLSRGFAEGVTVSGFVSYDHREYDQSPPGAKDNSHDNIGGNISYDHVFSGVTRLNLSVYSRFSPSERFSQAFYRDTGVEGMFTAHFAKRMEASVNLSFSGLDYENLADSTTDTYLKTGFTLGYRATHWLSIRGRYQYSKRNADDENFGYENNLYSMYMHFYFDFLR